MFSARFKDRKVYQQVIASRESDTTHFDLFWNPVLIEVLNNIL
jgi:hypothetical protein